MAKSTDTAARCKAIVKALHDGAGRGSIARLAEHLSDDFELFLPAFLPWGGIFGKARFLALLDHLPDVLDVARLDYVDRDAVARFFCRPRCKRAGLAPRGGSSVSRP